MNGPADGDIGPTTGVMVITVWSEPSGLRARLRSSLDISRGTDKIAAAASAAEIQDAVAEWLALWAASR
ncbi:hypothetical protein ACIBQ1_03485 [Nonomuraea sp. NPDC050153]|uniref:hypothetical protein n=1 Tax=Nonomuraea sp. NPDC050153 TaxID=3364359 RepID=UPI0037A10683